LFALAFKMQMLKDCLIMSLIQELWGGIHLTEAAKISAVNQFDGTPVNVLWGQNRLGEPDAALDLTAIADDYVDLPAAVDSIFTSVITVACWVNYPAIPGGQSIFRSGPTPGLYDKYQATVWDSSVHREYDAALVL
jgi:hypothetical protein